MSNMLIVKSNSLIEAGYRLTLQEQKLMLKIISEIGKEDTELKPVSFTAVELADSLGLNVNGYYTELKKITKSLLGRTIQIKEPNGLLQVNWLSSAKYFDDRGIIELGLSEELKPYLLQLKDNFTKYKISNVINLKSIYSVRIYEMCKQYEKLKHREFDIDTLRNVLSLESDKYVLYSNFKRKILEVACKEITENTDIKVSFEEVKQSRKVAGVKFLIKVEEINNPIVVVPYVIKDNKNLSTEPVKVTVPTSTTIFTNEVETLYNKIRPLERIPTLKDYLENILKTTDYRVVESNIIYANKNAVNNYPAFLKRAIAEDFASYNRIKAKSINAIKNIIPTNLSENNNVSNDGLSEEEIFEKLKKVPTAEYIKLKKEYDNNKFIKKDIVSLERYVVINAIES